MVAIILKTHAPLAMIIPTTNAAPAAPVANESVPLAGTITPPVALV